MRTNFLWRAWEKHQALKVKLKVMLRPTVSRSVCFGVRHLDSYYCQLLVCWCVVPSLTRGRVCGLQLLLNLASGVVLGSESSRTHDHISLSQIWDSHRLEGQVPVFIILEEQGGPIIPSGAGLNLWIQSQPSKVQVILRPTVSRPVCLGVTHSSGNRDQFFSFLKLFS
jgi:hypothetical protein